MWSFVCREGKPEGTGTLEVCVCVCVLGIEPQNNNQREVEVSLTVREEELPGLCPTKSFHTQTCTHTGTK